MINVSLREGGGGERDGRGGVSNLVFYTQSTSKVIPGRGGKERGVRVRHKVRERETDRGS